MEWEAMGRCAPLAVTFLAYTEYGVLQYTPSGYFDDNQLHTDENGRILLHTVGCVVISLSRIQHQQLMTTVSERLIIVNKQIRQFCILHLVGSSTFSSHPFQSLHLSACDPTRSVSLGFRLRQFVYCMFSYAYV